MSADDRGPIRIAMWSGPRNVSTALMRAWENRRDTIVRDEPFYAHYLARTGKPHPGRETILERCETDADRVATSLAGPLPAGVRVEYQKQMAHHLLPSVSRGWMDSVRHGFLIRDPVEMVPSLLAVTPEATLLDTGLPQQAALRRERVAAGDPSPVVDARDLLADPEAMLRELCERFGVGFDPAMLTWPPGPRASDGIWAEHWYRNVERSTGFRPPPPRRREPHGEGAALIERCRPLYDELHAARLVPRAAAPPRE